jgi:hypothetical protein
MRLRSERDCVLRKGQLYLEMGGLSDVPKYLETKSTFSFTADLYI